MAVESIVKTYSGPKAYAEHARERSATIPARRVGVLRRFGR